MGDHVTNKALHNELLRAVLMPYVIWGDFESANRNTSVRVFLKLSGLYISNDFQKIGAGNLVKVLRGNVQQH